MAAITVLVPPELLQHAAANHARVDTGRRLGHIVCWASPSIDSAAGEPRSRSTPDDARCCYTGVVTDDETIDRHLGVVLDEVITAIQALKQVEWSASNAGERHALNQLRAYLGEQADAVSEAEEHIGGRDPSILSPTGHPLRNLRAEADGDSTIMLRRLLEHLHVVAADIRTRASEMAATEQGVLLAGLADGLSERLRHFVNDN